MDGGFRDGNAGGVDADMAGDAAREMDICDSHFGEFGLRQLEPSLHLSSLSRVPATSICSFESETDAKRVRRSLRMASSIRFSAMAVPRDFA